MAKKQRQQNGPKKRRVVTNTYTVSDGRNEMRVTHNQLSVLRFNKLIYPCTYCGENVFHTTWPGTLTTVRELLEIKNKE